MIITYERPEALEHDELDPNAPDADLDATGAECGRATVDVAGMDWRCTRAPHPGIDEHRAAFDRADDGPEGAVAIAWTYQYGTGGQCDGVDHAAPTHSLTVTLMFPERAARGIRADQVSASMISAALDHFWEGDLDDVIAAATTTP